MKHSTALFTMIVLILSLLFYGCAANGRVYYLARNYGDASRVLQELVYGTAWSPDGTWLLVGVGSTPHKTAFLFDAETSEVVWSTDEGDCWINSVAFSPDDRLFALGSGEGTVTVWDAKSFCKTAELPPDGDNNPISALSFLPDGRSLLLGDWNGRVRRWAFSTDRALTTITSLYEYKVVTSIHVFRDQDRCLVTGDSYSTGEGLVVVRMATGEKMLGITGDFHSADLSGDGSTIVAGRTGRAEVIRVEDGKVVSSFDLHEDKVCGVAFLDGGSKCISGDMKGNIAVWDATSGKLVQKLSELDRVRCIAPRPGAPDVAVGLVLYRLGLPPDGWNDWSNAPAEVPADYSSEGYTPTVHVSGRRFVNAALIARHHMKLGTFQKFKSILTTEAPSLRDLCSDLIVARADEQGADSAGLKAFFDQHVLHWTKGDFDVEPSEEGEPQRAQEGAEGPEMPFVPCYADRVIMWDRPVWVVVGNWESNGPNGLGCPVGHFVIFIVDPKTGEIIAYSQCG